jgi:hypothetical protein
MTTRHQRRKRSLKRGKRIYPFGVPPPKRTPVKYDSSQPTFEEWDVQRAEREAEARLAVDESNETPVDVETQELIDAVFGCFVSDHGEAAEGDLDDEQAGGELDDAGGAAGDEACCACDAGAGAADAGTDDDDGVDQFGVLDGCRDERKGRAR